ncbi:MAG TPA: lipopolysaccharide assembly protein LapA domain-containing protein [Pseudonocardia sp.]|jgi:uncharacterized integral membrane protein|nr:lipopolysaccharide assembly protein LapA domain-containing protein [Pseudonocardia sp.]
MTTEDAGRRPGDADGTRPGSVGPADPHADPATHPALRPADPPAPRDEPPTEPVATDRTGGKAPVGHTRAGGLWVGLILSAIVLVFLLVFILQNGQLVQINFLGWSGNLPTGVALLLAAVAGLLLVAIPGTARILQLRRAARRGGGAR